MLNIFSGFIVVVFPVLICWVIVLLLFIWIINGSIIGHSVYGSIFSFIESMNPLSRFLFFVVGSTVSDLGTEAGIEMHLSKRKYQYCSGIILGIAAGVWFALKPIMFPLIFGLCVFVVAIPMVVRFKRQLNANPKLNLNTILDNIYNVPNSDWKISFHVPGLIAQLFERPYMYLQAYFPSGERIRLVRYINEIHEIWVDDDIILTSGPYNVVTQRIKGSLIKLHSSLKNDAQKSRVNRIIFQLLSGTVKTLDRTT